jgi:hypothetical protein
LLLGVDKHFLSIGFSFIQMGNSFSFNLIDDDSLHTFSLSDQNRSLFFSLNFQDILVSIGLKNLLISIDLSSLDLSFQLKHLSLVGSLLIGQFLIFLILKGEFLIFLLFFMILKLKLQSSLFLKGTSYSWVYKDIGNIALFELDTILSKFAV